MLPNESSAPVIQAFLSYSRQDNEDFAIVTPFVSKLTALVRAKSGRNLEIFVDQVDIEWGADWRQRLEDGVQSALIFIPLLSANYVASQNCREEFFAFSSKANVLGVSELLLPVLLFQAPMFSVDSDDELVAMAAARQWEVIEDGLIAGGESPEFMTTMNGLSRRLIGALAKAESVIGESFETLTAPSDSELIPVVKGLDRITDKGTDPSNFPDEADFDEDLESSLGMSELIIGMNDGLSMMTNAAHELNPAIESLGHAVQGSGQLPENPTARQGQAWALRIAREVREPALTIETKGQELFAAVRRVNDSVVGLRALAQQAGEELGRSLNASLDEALNSFGDMEETESQLRQLLEALRTGELVSVALRKSLRPARRGLTRVTDSLQMINGWSSRV